ncbi:MULTISPECIES: phasin family protein [Undibacterium]|jgi:phasin family protein|uniref:Phasin family protein n=1 Tax=Undibacterium umbellatum TaxID=2762300 RepID=A0ABR6ZH05_9BURK|nr:MULTISPECIES: phasin family protein [Undibacterium]MBC3911014.1 phasin family protein [Undibacterium umbellatum]MDP1977016.1 phasin family protein [Undibacterium sp.]
MFTAPEQLSAATKANFDAQLALFTSLTGKAFEGVEKFIELNLNAAKSSLEESSAATKQLLAAKDPQEFFNLSAAQAQPTAEKVLAYSRHLSNIASSTQAEFTHAAEAQIAETNRKILSLIDEVSKNAPAGSEQFVSFFKTSIDNANASYDHISKSTKQAVEALEANLNNAVSTATKAATPKIAKK